MSVMRLAAAIQPSVELLRLRTNLNDHTNTKIIISDMNIFLKFLIGSSKAVFSPLSVFPLLDQLHHVSALQGELFSAALLIVSSHCIFAGSLFAVEKRKKKKDIPITVKFIKNNFIINDMSI